MIVSRDDNTLCLHRMFLDQLVEYCVDECSHAKIYYLMLLQKIELNLKVRNYNHHESEMRD